MLGKAVKIRHCPATVSAADSVTVDWVIELGKKFSRVFLHLVRTQETTGNEYSLVFGKVAEEGASQETGPRVFTRFRVPRGTKEPS